MSINAASGRPTSLTSFQPTCWHFCGSRSQRHWAISARGEHRQRAVDIKGVPTVLWVHRRTSSVEIPAPLRAIRQRFGIRGTPLLVSDRGRDTNPFRSSSHQLDVCPTQTKKRSSGCKYLYSPQSIPWKRRYAAAISTYTNSMGYTQLLRAAPRSDDLAQWNGIRMALDRNKVLDGLHIFRLGNLGALCGDRFW